MSTFIHETPTDCGRTIGDQSYGTVTGRMGKVICLFDLIGVWVRLDGGDK